jgi:hypothetical protein
VARAAQAPQKTARMASPGYASGSPMGWWWPGRGVAWGPLWWNSTSPRQLACTDVRGFSRIPFVRDLCRACDSAKRTARTGISWKNFLGVWVFSCGQVVPWVVFEEIIYFINLKNKELPVRSPETHAPIGTLPHGTPERYRVCRALPDWTAIGSKKESIVDYLLFYLCSPIITH